METRKVLTRDNISVEELTDRIEIVYIRSKTKL